MKKILNKSELVVDSKLEKVCSAWDARVFAKVRLADVFPISGSGISDTDYSYALKAHFDFVATEASTEPLFAVEYDGPLHSAEIQRARDVRKDFLCEFFSLPLLRVKSNHLHRYRSLDLMSWFVDAWFLERAFDEAQERGDIPWEEGFGPMSFMSVDGKDYPFWLAKDVQLEILALRKAGKIASDIQNLFIGSDKLQNTRAITALQVGNGEYVTARTAVKKQLFPVPVGDLVEQLVLFEVHSEIEKFLEGRSRLYTRQQVEDQLRSFCTSAAHIWQAGGHHDLVQVAMGRDCAYHA